MSLFGPEYSVFHLLAAALAGFIIGRVSATAIDPRRAGQKKKAAEADGSSAERDLERLPAAVRADVERLLAEGRIIEAVRDVRAALGLGLKEAKDVVDIIRHRIERRGARAP